MAIFGFLGAFRGQSGLDGLHAYGSQVANAAGNVQSPAHRSGDFIQFCSGSSVARDGSLAIALTGRPRLAGRVVADDPATAILARFRREDIGVLASLTGPFALAIVDGTRRRALLAIDRMGIERLAFCSRQGGIVFSTSAELIARSPEVGALVHPQALFDYLLHHAIPAPATIFRDVYKLHAGSYALFEDGALKRERYWKPKFTAGRPAPYEALRSELHESLAQAVTAEVSADEDAGCFLSGGLDSSTVTGMLSRASPSTAKTFSIGFGYPEYDELAYARIVNDHFHCKGHEQVIRGSDIVAAMPAIARAYDEPFGNSSALPTYYCALLARAHGVRHLLAGDGGDELFAGNSRYVEQLVFERYALVPEPVRRGLLEPVVSGWPDSFLVSPVRRARSYIKQANTPLPDRLESWNLLVRLGLTEVLSREWLDTIDPQHPFSEMRALWGSTPSDAYLHRMLYYDWQYTLADNDLRKVQTMCALAGVRVSYPMLYPQVVDLSTRIPPRLMMPSAKLRDFYKRTMRGFLPEVVILKKKHGFGLPFGLWLRDSEELRSLIFDNLTALRKRRILREDFIDRLLELHREEDARYYGVFLWVAVMLELWLREHAVSL
ncbi:MAG: asparagine synthetase B family protein [Steroidobacteraceae bacterium]